MLSCVPRRAAAFRGAALTFASAFVLCAHAATPITVTSKTATDGPIRYTVKVVSRQFGNAQETRTLRSGETDDFTWRTTPPGGAVPTPDGCPDMASLPLDANGAMIRQTQVRLAPIVASNGTANVQLSFRAQAPRGTHSVTSGGKSLSCPQVTQHSQVIRFSMPTTGAAKTVKLADGTQITISAMR
ncbi:MAG TPA: DUF6013 family protein [Paraburkholderia sp.]|jgi:hypothetical protein